jgi:ribosome-associated translation inhibitor RaiA
MQVEIEGRNTHVRQSWRNLIEQKLGKSEHFPNEITHARVTITHNPHHACCALVVTPREHVRLSAALIHYRNAYLLLATTTVVVSGR